MPDDIRNREGVDEVLLGRRYVRPEGEQTARAMENSTAVGRFARELNPYRAIGKIPGYIREDAADAAQNWQNARPGMEKLLSALEFAMSPFNAGTKALVRDPVLSATGDMRKAQDAENAAYLAGGYRALMRQAARSAVTHAPNAIIRGAPGPGSLAMTAMPLETGDLPESDGREADHGLYDAYGDMRGLRRAPTMALGPRALARERSLWDSEYEGARPGLPPLHPGGEFIGMAGGGLAKLMEKVTGQRKIFPKPERMFPEDARPKGGEYIDARTGQPVTGEKVESAVIGITPEGKPVFVASDNTVDMTGSPGRGSAKTKTNLFRQTAGWKWMEPPEGYENVPTLVAVENRGNHYYGLSADFPKGVDLARYPDAPSEPRLRPTTQGNVYPGEQVGSISVRGREHPVYDMLTVRNLVGPIAAGASLPALQSAFTGENSAENTPEFSSGGPVDRLHYWDRIPLGKWRDSTDQDVRDYIDTELLAPLQPRPRITHPQRGLDPLNESRDLHWRDLQGYEDGGEVEDATEDSSESGEEPAIDEETLQNLVAWLAAQEQGKDVKHFEDGGDAGGDGSDTGGDYSGGDYGGFDGDWSALGASFAENAANLDALSANWATDYAGYGGVDGTDSSSYGSFADQGGLDLNSFSFGGAWGNDSPSGYDSEGNFTGTGSTDAGGTTDVGGSVDTSGSWTDNSGWSFSSDPTGAVENTGVSMSDALGSTPSYSSDWGMTVDNSAPTMSEVTSYDSPYSSVVDNSAPSMASLVSSYSSPVDGYYASSEEEQAAPESNVNFAALNNSTQNFSPEADLPAYGAYEAQNQQQFGLNPAGYVGDYAVSNFGGRGTDDVAGSSLGELGAEGRGTSMTDSTGQVGDNIGGLAMSGDASVAGMGAVSGPAGDYAGSLTDGPAMGAAAQQGFSDATPSVATGDLAGLDLGSIAMGATAQTSGFGSDEGQGDSRGSYSSTGSYGSATTDAGDPSQSWSGAQLSDGPASDYSSAPSQNSADADRSGNEGGYDAATNASSTPNGMTDYDYGATMAQNAVDQSQTPAPTTQPSTTPSAASRAYSDLVEQVAEANPDLLARLLGNTTTALPGLSYAAPQHAPPTVPGQVGAPASLAPLADAPEISDNRVVNQRSRYSDTTAPQSEVNWMARAMIGEAENGGREGMAAVGHAINNRANTNHGGYGNTVADQVQARNQFSYLSRSRDQARVGRAERNDTPTWQEAQQLARDILEGRAADPVRGSVMYHNPNITRGNAASAPHRQAETRGRVDVQSDSPVTHHRFSDFRNEFQPGVPGYFRGEPQAIPMPPSRPANLGPQSSVFDRILNAINPIGSAQAAEGKFSNRADPSAPMPVQMVPVEVPGPRGPVTVGQMPRSEAFPGPYGRLDMSVPAVAQAREGLPSLFGLRDEAMVRNNENRQAFGPLIGMSPAQVAANFARNDRGQRAGDQPAAMSRSFSVANAPASMIAATRPGFGEAQVFANPNDPHDPVTVGIPASGAPATASARSGAPTASPSPVFAPSAPPVTITKAPQSLPPLGSPVDVPAVGPGPETATAPTWSRDADTAQIGDSKPATTTPLGWLTGKDGWGPVNTGIGMGVPGFGLANLASNTLTGKSLLGNLFGAVSPAEIEQSREQANTGDGGVPYPAPRPPSTPSYAPPPTSPWGGTGGGGLAPTSPYTYTPPKGISAFTGRRYLPPSGNMTRYGIDRPEHQFYAA